MISTKNEIHFHKMKYILLLYVPRYDVIREYILNFILNNVSHMSAKIQFLYLIQNHQKEI